MNPARTGNARLRVRSNAGRDQVIARRISILAVDDHSLVREGLARVLDGDDDFKLVDQAANGMEAVEIFRRLRPDVTLLDIQMPGMGGIETLIRIRREFPDAKVIILTVYRGAAPGRRALRAGAAGYVPKSVTREELQDAIRVVHCGGQYVSADVASDLANSIGRDELSDAEVAILRLVAAGFSNKRVGLNLRVPEETVKSRMKSILRKLSALDRTHCVSLALMQGIIELD